VDQGDLAGAKELLQTLSNQSNNELSQLAKLRLVRLYLATGEFEKGLQLINDVDPKKTAGFSDNYDELVGDLYVALDRTDEARSSYEKAKHNGLQSPLLQFKIDDLTAPEKLESIK
jgi:predicted negative regulator of RcsB-dependent stress response